VCTLLPPAARYTFSLAISKGSGSSLRSASASVNVRRRSGASPTGRIVRWCGVSLLDGQPVVCPARHNPTQPLSLLLFPDTGFERARVTCGCLQQRPCPQLLPLALPGVVTGSCLCWTHSRC
jgi:hypothetical protein